MSNVVSRESFDSASQETKLLLIFDMLHDHNKLLSEHVSSQAASCRRRNGICDKRFLKIERRKYINSGLTILSGFCGGMIAVIIKSKFWL